MALPVSGAATETEAIQVERVADVLAERDRTQEEVQELLVVVRDYEAEVPENERLREENERLRAAHDDLAAFLREQWRSMQDVKRLSTKRLNPYYGGRLVSLEIVADRLGVKLTEGE